MIPETKTSSNRLVKIVFLSFFIGILVIVIGYMALILPGVIPFMSFAS